jgi:hypothetical protein
MTNVDKDERFMATSDVCQLLQRDGKLDSVVVEDRCALAAPSPTPPFAPLNLTSPCAASPALAGLAQLHAWLPLSLRLCAAILKLLHDSSNDVQSIAVRW